ncbi:hypothetical protein [Limnohabitans sp. Rim8]|nr:hypothetical protein [Limnohabitans sp. Rim8]
MQHIGFIVASGLMGHGNGEKRVPSWVKAQAQIDLVKIGKAH